MVVVSNSTFIQDNALTQDQQALDFVSGSVNWLLSREQMIGIAPKIPQTAHFQPRRNCAAQLALARPGLDAAGAGDNRLGGVVETAGLIRL